MMFARIIFCITLQFGSSAAFLLREERVGKQTKITEISCGVKAILSNLNVC